MHGAKVDCIQQCGTACRRCLIVSLQGLSQKFQFGTIKPSHHCLAGKSRIKVVPKANPRIHRVAVLVGLGVITARGVVDDPDSFGQESNLRQTGWAEKKPKKNAQARGGLQRKKS